jgi:hypothetical protein
VKVHIFQTCKYDRIQSGFVTVASSRFSQPSCSLQHGTVAAAINSMLNAELFNETASQAHHRAHPLTTAHRHRAALAEEVQEGRIENF